MQDTTFIYQIITISAALIGTYVKMIMEITKMKSRIFVLEQSSSEVTTMLKKLHDDLNEIKLLLARKQIDK
jgi:hypothetical protein